MRVEVNNNEPFVNGTDETRNIFSQIDERHTLNDNYLPNQ